VIGLRLGLGLVLGLGGGYAIDPHRIFIKARTILLTDNTMAKGKMTKGQATIYKTLNIKLKIE